MYDAADVQQPSAATLRAQSALGAQISSLAFEITNTAGQLETLNTNSKAMADQLVGLMDGAGRIGAAVTEMAARLGEVDNNTAQAQSRTHDTIGERTAPSFPSRKAMIRSGTPPIAATGASLMAVSGCGPASPRRRFCCRSIAATWAGA